MNEEYTISEQVQIRTLKEELARQERRKQSALLNAVQTGFNEGFTIGYKTGYENARKEKRLGKWIHKWDDHFDWLQCSECEYGSEGEVKYGEGTPYCPMCGAKMEAGE